METLTFKLKTGQSLFFPRAHLRWARLEKNQIILKFSTGEVVSLQGLQSAQLFVGLLNGEVSEVVQVEPQHLLAGHEVTAIFLSEPDLGKP